MKRGYAGWVALAATGVVAGAGLTGTAFAQNRPATSGRMIAASSPLRVSSLTKPRSILSSLAGNFLRYMRLE